MTPRPLLVVCAALAGAPFIAAVWFPAFAIFGWVLNGLLAAAASIDAFRTLRPETIRVRRDVDDVLSVEAEHLVSLTLRADVSRPVSVTIDDEPPQGSLAVGLPVSLRLTDEASTASYLLRPFSRGASSFGDVHVVYPSPWGLWQRRSLRVLPRRVRIYPNLRPLERFELLSRRHRLHEAGVTSSRLVGPEGELDGLRDYRRGDPKRHIDWRASAKHRALISRELTTERSGTLLVMLDCGQTMQAEHEGRSALDRGLDAALLLCHVAIRNGDRVAFVAFSDAVHRKLTLSTATPSGKLVRETFDLTTSEHVSDYGIVRESVAGSRPAPSLVVLISGGSDPRHASAMGAEIRPLTRDHQIACVLLKDGALDAFSKREPTSTIEEYETKAAREMLEAQEHELRGLRASGVHALVARPHDLSTLAVHHYLDVKARHPC